jgi:hypothetical protein
LKRLLTCVALALAAPGSGGCSCDTNDTLLEAMKVAIPYPEDFATYALAHSSDFDSDFKDCASEVITQLDHYIQEQEDLCHETFADPDLLDGCLGEDLAPFRALRTDASILKGLLPIQSASQWTSHSLYQALILVKSYSPQYASLNLEAINTAASALVCKHCSFLGL